MDGFRDGWALGEVEDDGSALVIIDGLPEVDGRALGMLDGPVDVDGL